MACARLGAGAARGGRGPALNLLVMRITALLLKPISDWSQVLDRVLLASALAFSCDSGMDSTALGDVALGDVDAPSLS